MTTETKEVVASENAPLLRTKKRTTYMVKTTEVTVRFNTIAEARKEAIRQRQNGSLVKFVNSNGTIMTL